MKLRIAAPASDNRANAAIVDFLHEALGLPRASIRITQGARSRRKLVELDACNESLKERLCAWDAQPASA